MDKSPEYKLEKLLRRKFVMVSFSVVFAVLFLICIVVNSINYLQVELKARELVNIIANNDGTFPIPQIEASDPTSSNDTQSLPPKNLFLDVAPSRVHEEASFTTRFFTVLFDENNQIIRVDTSKVHMVSAKQAEHIGILALDSYANNTTIGQFHYSLQEVEDGNKLSIFVDISEDLYLFQSFFVSSIVICLVALFFVLLLLILLSKKAVAPIVASYAKQKEFITDMSHELKTPLTIVKANNQVLEMVHGDSQWTQSTNHQVEKLNSLVNRLLSLAKLEEVEKGEPNEFSLSELVSTAGENVKVLIEQEEKTLILDIEKDVVFTGDFHNIRQLLDILLDNALKYSPRHSTIYLSLKVEKHKKVVLIKNKGKNLKKGSYQHWFHRFYREEGSRNSETGGFGLGLSMAETIVKNHDGRIYASSPEGEIVEIKVELP